MMIPFYDYVVTKENYDKVESYSNHNISILRTEEGIKISFKLTYPSNLFYYDGCYSLSEECLADYLRSKGVILSKRAGYQEWEDKKISDKLHWSIRQLDCNYYEPIERIGRLWKYVVILPDMSFRVEYEDNVPLCTVPLKESKDILTGWIRRYKNLFNTLDGEDLVWELSAGFDSRALAYFYKKPTFIYSKDDFEYATAKRISDRLGVPISSKKQSNKMTVSGKGNFSTLTKELLENWVGIRQYKFLVNGVCPYLDREYLKIEGSITKKVLNIFLCPELIDIPYITYCDKGFIFRSNDIKKIKKEYSFLFDEAL